ncbi:MAG: NUDIX hydrolase [Gammaproteobacteria bacterium]|nr:MAG: NUDIX hydrolase [Gammaproteobacteria bacterium]
MKKWKEDLKSRGIRYNNQFSKDARYFWEEYLDKCIRNSIRDDDKFVISLKIEKCFRKHRDIIRELMANTWMDFRIPSKARFHYPGRIGFRGKVRITRIWDLGTKKQIYPKPINEGRNPVVMYHVTPLGNVPSILKHGLIPKFGGGNFDDHLETIGGVYMTRDIDDSLFILSDIPGPKAVVEIRVDRGALKADEDRIIDAIQNGIAEASKSTSVRFPIVYSIIRHIRRKLERYNIKYNKQFLEDLYVFVDEILNHARKEAYPEKEWYYTSDFRIWLHRQREDLERLFNNTWMDPNVDKYGRVTFHYPGKIGFRGKVRIIKIWNHETGEVIYPPEGKKKPLTETLKKVNGKWAIVSKKTGKPLRYYKGHKDKPSKEWVRQQEREIQMFKHMRESRPKRFNFNLLTEATKNGYAGIIAVTKDGQVLLLKRANGFTYPNQWNAPGGGIEDNENPLQAAYREFQEEAGVDLRRAGKPYYLGKTRTPKGADYHNFLIVVDKPFKVRLNKENTDAGWFSFEDLPRPIIRPLVSVLNRVKKMIENKSR